MVAVTDPVTVPFEGQKLRLGDRDFVVPALTMAQVEQFEGDLARAFQVSVLSPREDRELLLTIILAAVQRNYPSMTRDELAERMDLASMPRVFWAVVGYSGLVRKEDETAGEPLAGMPATGEASSPKS